MRKYFRFLIVDKVLQRVFLLSFFLIVITFAYTLFNYSKLPALLPVFNQLPWGEQRLSNTVGIFLPTIVVLVFFVFNVFLSILFYKTSPLLSRLLAVTCFITSLLAFLFTIRTISLIV